MQESYRVGTPEYFKARAIFLDQNGLNPAGAEPGADFMSLVRQYKADHGVDLAGAMRAIVASHPAAYRAYMAKSRKGAA